MVVDNVPSRLNELLRDLQFKRRNYARNRWHRDFVGVARNRQEARHILYLMLGEGLRPYWVKLEEPPYIHSSNDWS